MDNKKGVGEEEDRREKDKTYEEYELEQRHPEIHLYGKEQVFDRKGLLKVPGPLVIR